MFDYRKRAYLEINLPCIICITIFGTYFFKQQIMTLGRLQGIILFVLGAIFGIAALIMLNQTGSVLQLFFAAPPLILLGLAMIILPGADIPVSEHNDSSKQKQVFTDAPLLHKIVWGVAFVSGLIITIYYLLTSFEI